MNTRSGHNEISKVLALASAFFRKARLARSPGLVDVIVAKGTDEVVEKAGRLAFLISREMGAGLGNEGLKGFLESFITPQTDLCERKGNHFSRWFLRFRIAAHFTDAYESQTFHVRPFRPTH